MSNFESVILRNLATGVVVLDRSLNVQYVNEASEQLFNISHRRAKDLLITELAKDDGELAEVCHKVFETRTELRLRNHSMMLPTNVQERELDFLIAPFVAETASAGRYIVLECSEPRSWQKISRDEEFMRRQQSNRDVIRGMAHEIRNPLGGIRGAAQLMSDEAGSEAFREYTRIIIEQTDRLTKLLNRMQAETHLDLEQNINIHSILEDVRQLLIAEHSHGVVIRQDYDPSLPLVTGNRDLMIQAILNVAKNAAEAISETGGSGEIIFQSRIDRLPGENPRRQAVRVSIQDDGPGIDPELSQRIFDPMVTGKASGTGLGLPISAEIVNKLGGAIDYHCIKEKTVFNLYFPAAVAQQ